MSVFTDPETILTLAARMRPLPAVLTRLAALSEDIGCDLESVAETIRMDPVLTLKLLKVANSSFSASALPVSTVHEAVMRLGIALVVSMAFTVSVGGLMSSALPPYGLEAGQLWRHSALSAIAAEHLVRSSPDRIPPAAITAALLHDIGKLLVAQNADEEVFAFIRRAQEEGGLKLQDAEMEIMGVNHAEIGGIVAQHWALPDRIVRAIMYHHSPGQWDDPICDAVYVANVAATTIEAAGIEAAAPEAPSQEVMSRLDLHPFDFPKFCSQCAERFTRLRALYGA